MANPYLPVIIIGAARSGTKLVRDLTARHPDVDRIPYDVNYIWHVGNQNVSHDELTPDRYSTEIGGRIVCEMEKFRNGAAVLVEKTVGNCVRVPFVSMVFPQARFIHLLRDGVDVVESVYRQWQSPPNWGEVFRKLRTFPWREGFRYILDYARNSALRMLTPEKRKAGTWGVRYQDIDRDLQRFELIEVCALQWFHCVKMASEALSALPSERVLSLRYEDLVNAPAENMDRIARFIGVDATPYKDFAYNSVSGENVGKGRSRLSERQLDLIRPHIASWLERLGYDSPAPAKAFNSS